jgi:subtilase family serine protease
MPVENSPKQPNKISVHQTDDTQYAEKGADRQSRSMHAEANAVSALSLSVLLCLFCLAETLVAQGPLKDRIVEAVDTSHMTVVEGNVQHLARAEFDRGRVDPAMPMRVTVTFKMTAAQQADLDALLAAQQKRGSPDYQRWLTPEQFGSRFGLSQGDIHKVTAWLEGRGFHVENVPASRNMITFTGTAQQVESALHTEIHRYVADGEAHFANASDPSVPAAFADVVMGFRGLNNFQLKPRVLRKMNPKFTSSVSGNRYLAPPDFATIYDLNSLYNQGITGSGQKIAIMGQSDVALSDIRAFRSNSGLPVNDPQPTNQNNSAFVGLIVPGDADPGMRQGDIDEANLDVEWGGAIAYDATVIFIVGDPVNGGGVMDAIIYAITTSPIPAPVISTSYGDCEADIPSSQISSLQALMQQANAEGITVLAPAGDSGAADCDFNNPSNPTTASTLGLAVDLPGALESVTSVGGTEFQEGGGTYWKTASGTDVLSSALSYIPEEAWNDTNLEINGSSIGLSSGGGGSSSVIAKPSWQAGTGVPNDGARDVPDVSLSASEIHDGYLICDENFDSSTNTFSPTCVSPFGFRASAGGTLAVVGGTSVGPPVMAGIVALINQFTNHPSGSGNINTILYPLAAHTPSAFHDVTTGNNQVPYSPPCVAQTQIGYGATPGYDLATGLGSIDAFVLVTNWTSVTTASTTNATASVDFSLAFTPAQLSVKRGACGTGTLILTRLNGFVGTPSFTCTVPASLGTTTCAVVPAVSSSFDVPRNYRELDRWEIMGLVLIALGFLVMNLRRSEGSESRFGAWARLVPGFAVVTALAFMIGCGSASKDSSDAPSVSYALAIQVPSTAPAASGIVTVNAAIGAIDHAAQITVNSQ